MQLNLLLIGAGALAGLIDSIAGGGGLITLPALGLALGTGVQAIASNKIVGTAGALTALIVYARKGHLNWRAGIGFVVAVALGSFTGSRLAPFLSPAWIRGMLLVLCPILLFVIWRRDQWISTSFHSNKKTNSKSIVIAGYFCGIYDGAFGPGGGTVMLLSLLHFGKLPLFSALAISKLANTASASTSLVSYTQQGHVHWLTGSLVAIGMTAGALLGANLNLKNAEILMKPMLLLAVTLLLGKLLLF